MFKRWRRNNSLNTRKSKTLHCLSLLSTRFLFCMESDQQRTTRWENDWCSIRWFSKRYLYLPFCAHHFSCAGGIRSVWQGFLVALGDCNDFSINKNGLSTLQRTSRNMWGKKTCAKVCFGVYLCWFVFGGVGWYRYRSLHLTFYSHFLFVLYTCLSPLSP